MNNKLEKQLISLIADTYKLADKEHEQILLLYRQSRNNINDFLASIYARYGDNGQLDYSTFVNLGLMDEVDNEIRKELNSLGFEEIALLTGILATVYATSYYKSAYAIENNIQLKINFNLLRPNQIDTIINFDWSGIPFSERIWRNVDSLRIAIREELARGVREGKSIDQMARRINKQFGSKAYQSQRLMRTEAARLIDEATQQLYEDSEVVKYVEWVATLEENTCEECEELDGQRFRLDNGSKPSLPRHPNCRCTYIPVIYEDYQPTKRKDNETKEIIDYKSYDEWYKNRING